MIDLISGLFKSELFCLCYIVGMYGLVLVASRAARKGLI